METPILERKPLSPPPDATRAGVPSALPLSPTQEGMLFHHLRSTAAGVDIVQIAVSLPEAVNAESLREAWRQLARHRRVFRSAFRWKGLEKPVREIVDSAEAPWTQDDWSGMPETNRTKRWDELLAADRRAGFSLSEAPAYRLRLIRRGPADFILLWTYHHILLDSPSAAAALEEVFAAYAALRDSKTPQWPERRPYEDFLIGLEQRDRPSEKAFWTERLRGFRFPTPLPLSASTARAEEGPAEFARSQMRLSAEASERLRRFAKEQGISLRSVCEAVWGLLLSRYTSEEEVVFGSARSARGNFKEDEAPLGVFVNAVPVRVAAASEAELQSWIREHHARDDAARLHEAAALVDVQSWSEVKGGAALFETLFSFDHESLSTYLKRRDPSWKARDVELIEQTGYPIELTIADDPEILLEIAYDRRLLQDEPASRILGHVSTALASAVSNPRQKIWEVEWLTEAERRTILQDWNRTQAPFPRDICVHDLFLRQAAKTPDAVAVRSLKGELTYRQLEERSARLAAALKHHGVGPDALVGICAERSLEVSMAVLGIMRAGGAYVPMDPAYPRDRIAHMLDDSRAPVLLTQRKLADTLPPSNAKILFLDDWESWAPPAPAPAPSSTPDHLAYVIYTSGSTGKPKGIMMPHRPVVNFITWQMGNSRAREGTKTMQFASLSFDVSFQELFSTWGTGGTLVLVTEEMRRDPKLLLEYIVEQGGERLCVPNVALSQIAEVIDEVPRLPTTLTEIITAGEQLQCTKNVAHLFQRLPNCTLQNQYGPTECAVIMTYYDLTGDPAKWPALPSVGKPLSNSTAYILDDHLRPVPVGVTGQAYIGGACVGRGYWNRPELTAEKFIPDPFTPAGDQTMGTTGEPRLYATGDNARFLPTGDIEFLGRMDHMVKIRGFRIELGEIETRLAEHPHVGECVVIAAKDPSGIQRLVAYFVADSGAPSGPTPQDLRDFLKTRLPEFMVPAAFVELPKLPLTPNGKVDRRALPAPEQSSLESQDEYVAPRDKIEEKLAGIWGEVLNLPRVGVRDNFFHIGGHSLLAVRMFSRIEKAFGKNLPLATLFQAPTIEALAPRLREDAGAAAWNAVVPIQPNGAKPPFFCVHGAGGNVLFCRPLAESIGPDQPFYGVQSRGLDGKAQPLGSIEEMAREYLAEIRKIQPKGPYYFGGFCMGGVVALEMARLLELEGETVGLLIFLDTPEAQYALRQTKGYFHDERSLGERLADNVRKIQALSWAGRAAYFVEKAANLADRGWNHISAAIHRYRLRTGDPIALALKRVNDTNEAAYHRYVYPGAYQGAVALFFGEQVPSGDETPDPLAGWGRYLRGEVRLNEVKGVHGTIFTDKNIASCADKIASALTEAQRRASAAKTAS